MTVFAMIDLKKELELVMHDITWNFVGILDTEKKLHPIPKNIQIQALFEYLALKRLEQLAKKLKCKIIEASSTREYPDATIEGGKLGDRKIAIDIKTTRRINPNRISGFTIGSYAGYFRNPNRKRPGCRIPYADFTKHWIAGFIYDWDKNADTLHMVSNVELIVQEKWRIASKSTGTGTTTAIGSIKDINRIKNGEGDFNSEEEFLHFWRNKRVRGS